MQPHIRATLFSFYPFSPARMKPFIRSLVASPKQLHYDEKLQLQLDLSYINSRVIVCSGPVNSVFKSIYRTPVVDLVRFLNANHKNHWKIWNFRGEGKGYQDSDVSGKIVYLPFPDHQPPTLKIIEESVRGMDEFLQGHKENVVVLHCKAGKGRSGTLCCAYLMYKHHFDVDKAIELYSVKRMREFAGDGVTIKSQRRYLEYWGQCLNDKELYGRAIRRRRDSTIHDTSFGKGRVLYYITLNNPIETLKSNEQILKLNFQLNCYFTKKDFDGPTSSYIGVEIGNLYSLGDSADIEILDKSIRILPHEVFVSEIEDIQLMFKDTYYCWFNKYCEEKKKPESAQDLQPILNSLKLDWDEIDGFKGTEYKGMRLFESISITWEKT